MKLQIVETPDYILGVSDEEIKEGDLYLDDIHTIRKSITSVKEYWEARKDYKKIIAYLPKNNAPELDLPLLPNKVYSEDDLRNHCIDFLRYFQTTAELEFHSTGENHGLPHSEVFNKYIQSMKQPKWFVAEVEYYYHSSKEFYSDAGFVKCSKGQYESIKSEIPTCPLKTELKTTTINGKTYLVGTYEY
jgi:hypothetical protein